jgi:putative peptidoglycan lipid II flippase
MDELRASLAASLRGILFLALPAAIGLIMLRQPMVALMLEYGKFDEQSTQMVSWALLWYAAGLVGHCIVEILSRSFYALHNTRTPVIVGVLAMALNIGLSILFSAWFERIGWLPHGGLALANSLATGLEAAILWVLMRRRLNGIQGQRVALGVGQASLGSAAMALALWGWAHLIGGQSAWIVGIGGVVVGGAVYGLSVFLLGVEEIRQILGAVRARFGVR